LTCIAIAFFAKTNPLRSAAVLIAMRADWVASLGARS